MGKAAPRSNARLPVREQNLSGATRPAARSALSRTACSSRRNGSRSSAARRATSPVRQRRRPKASGSGLSWGQASRSRKSSGSHSLLSGGATAEALADWPWVDCVADLGPGSEAPSLDDLLDRLRSRTGRHVVSVIRAGAAGLALMASGPYLTWLPLELLARLPGRPLSPLPLEFGRRRCPTGLVLRRSAESLAPVRTLRDLIQDTAHRARG